MLVTETATERLEPAIVGLFPYLLIAGRMQIGPYELISKAALTEGDFLAPWIDEQTRQLLRMYELHGSMGNRFGTVVRRSDSKIGQAWSTSDAARLRQAVMTAALDRNPSWVDLGMEEIDQIEGWRVWTSDHALFYFHRLDGSGGVAVEYGRMAQVLTGGLNLGDEDSKIFPPTEIHTNFLSPDPDQVYADAVWQELAKDSSEARRLEQAIDWLDIVWRNTPSIDDRTRIAAAFFGFEVLLDKEGVSDLRQALADLLDPGGATTIYPVPRRPRPGQPAELRLTALREIEWWFTFYAFLRNDIAHGNPVEKGQYLWNDKPQLFLGESYLRKAIKQEVANPGHPDVMLDPLQRIAARFDRGRGR